MGSDAPDPINDSLARRWRPALMAFFRRRLHDPAEAEDLTHEVLLRLLDRKEARGDSYVFQIAQNLLIDRGRRQAVRARFLNAAGAERGRDRDPLDAHHVVDAQQQLGLAKAVLAGLPDRTRRIFLLYRIEKMSQGEIAAAFGISASAVKQQVAKAMAALARALQDGE